MIALLSQHVWCFPVASISSSRTQTEQRMQRSSNHVCFPLLQIPCQAQLLVVKLMARNENAVGYDGDDDADDGWDSGSDNVVAKAQPPTEQPTTVPQQPKQQSQHLNRDDLFIPIFTLVSISGLLGAYGYEMIRLYIRGELYLPFLH